MSLITKRNLHEKTQVVVAISISGGTISAGRILKGNLTERKRIV